MSILIKDIDLPKDDKPLNLEIYSDGHIWINWGPEYERKDNVAIQIDRPHGRLIDEREVKKAQFIINDQWGSYPVISLGNLNCVPTILEVEE